MIILLKLKSYGDILNNEDYEVRTSGESPYFLKMLQSKDEKLQKIAKKIMKNGWYFKVGTKDRAIRKSSSIF